MEECRYYLIQFNAAIEALEATGSKQYAMYEKAFQNAYMAWGARAGHGEE